MQVPLWVHRMVALFWVFIFAAVVYIVGIIIRDYRKPVHDPPEPRVDPDYPLKRTDEG